MNKSKRLKYCATCAYYKVLIGVCRNVDSEHVSDFMDMTDMCEAWEGITDREDVSEISEKKIELKPCPFCGGKATYHRSPAKTNGGWCDSVTVKCERCEARTNRILYDKKKHGEDGEYDEAREAWNRRATNE